MMTRVMFSGLVRTIVAKRAGKGEKMRFGDFEIGYVLGNGDDFDYGVNYLQCGNYTFVKTHGGEAFAPYVCMSDIALGEAMGWGLIRTGTLADGCARCDFRFKAGAATQISSKTPDVQVVIDGIRRHEAQRAAGPPSAPRPAPSA